MSLLLAREANMVIDDAGFALKLQSSLRNAMETGARQLRRGDWELPEGDRSALPG